MGYNVYKNQVGGNRSWVTADTSRDDGAERSVATFVHLPDGKIKVYSPSDYYGTCLGTFPGPISALRAALREDM